MQSFMMHDVPDITDKCMSSADRQARIKLTLFLQLLRTYVPHRLRIYGIRRRASGVASRL